MNEINQLLLEYSETFSQLENRPEWAVRKKSDSNQLVPPSIPFVGKNYDQTKVLLYASAENLMYYTRSNEHSDILDDPMNAVNRHRYSFEKYSKDDFFPYVHIAPINDGSLLTVTSYILKKMDIIFHSKPIDLAESISLGNFGKFSIGTNERNIDYASNIKYLKYSLPYIEADLSILKPQVIIMPAKIYEKKAVRSLINEILPSVTVIPIYQINARNINMLFSRQYEKKEISEISDFYEWQKRLSNGITGKTNDNFLSVYTYIDKILEDKTNELPQKI
ncbi:MAG: hypothetical protein RIG62_09900 [Cyclobacteriaceae bacterium]